MNDMTDEQRKAARAAFSAFPRLQMKLTRGNGSVTITPTLGSLAGNPVSVVYGASSSRQLTKDLQLSCTDLMGQV